MEKLISGGKEGEKKRDKNGIFGAKRDSDSKHVSWRVLPLLKYPIIPSSFLSIAAPSSSSSSSSSSAAASIFRRSEDRSHSVLTLIRSTLLRGRILRRESRGSLK
ncbi:unnamed protein product [Citrullus colocynthis]|uniref:Uncharacterized protein n=1 Tax=Citrullus colocynthis TaxID=252529 RepID=A0ABP0YGQ1_9ROSI